MNANSVSLVEVLARGPLPPVHVLRMVDDLAGVLDERAAGGRPHGMVRPEAVRIESGRAVLTAADPAQVDLDATVVTGDSEAAAAATFESAGFSAPERLRGGFADSRSDEYSLACVAFTALTGTQPYNGITPASIVIAHAQDRIPAVSGRRRELPHAVDQVFFRALAKDPAQRFPTSRAFASELRQSVERGVAAPGTPSVALPPATSSPVFPPPVFPSPVAPSPVAPSPVAPSPVTVQPDSIRSGPAEGRGRSVGLMAVLVVDAVVALTLLVLAFVPPTVWAGHFWFPPEHSGVSMSRFVTQPGTATVIAGTLLLVSAVVGLIARRTRGPAVVVGLVALAGTVLMTVWYVVGYARLTDLGLTSVWLTPLTILLLVTVLVAGVVTLVVAAASRPTSDGVPARAPGPAVHGSALTHGGVEGLELTTKFFPVAWLFFFLKPVVEVDGQRVPAMWGVNRFPLAPGRHHVHVHVPYLVPSRVGPADADVDVAPGSTAVLEYRAPAWAFSDGAMGSAPQRYNGIGITMAVLLVPFLLFVPLIAMALSM